MNNLRTGMLATIQLLCGKTFKLAYITRIGKDNIVIDGSIILPKNQIAYVRGV